MSVVLKNTNVDKKVFIDLDTPNICVTHTHTPLSGHLKTQKNRAVTHAKPPHTSAIIRPTRSTATQLVRCSMPIKRAYTAFALCQKAIEQFQNLFTRVLSKKADFLGCVSRFCSRKSLSWTASPDFVQESHFLGLRRPISFKKVTFLGCVARFCSRKSLSWTAPADFAQEIRFLGLRPQKRPVLNTLLYKQNINYQTNQNY